MVFVRPSAFAAPSTLKRAAATSKRRVIAIASSSSPGTVASGISASACGNFSPRGLRSMPRIRASCSRAAFSAFIDSA